MDIRNLTYTYSLSVTHDICDLGPALFTSGLHISLDLKIQKTWTNEKSFE